MAGLACSAADSTNVALDTLLLRNGDSLGGKLLSIDTGQVLRWKTPDVAEAIEFKLDGVSQLDLHPSPFADRGNNFPCKVSLTQGDVAAVDDARFEQLFATPRAHDLVGIAHAFGHEAVRVAALSQLRAALDAALDRSGLSVIVVDVPTRDENVRLHDEWNETVKGILQGIQ